MLVHCTTCNKALERWPSIVRRNKTGSWFCSAECRHTFDRTSIAEPCPVCNKEFSYKPYRKKHSKIITCSQACRFVVLGWGSRVVYCAWCGEDFRRRNAEFSKRNKHFCSRICMGKWQSSNIKGEASPTWRGGYQPYYGADWKTRRREARIRDGHQCKACGCNQSGLSYTIEVHHIKPVRLFPVSNDANELSNLITLCRPCHIKADVLARWLFDKARRQSENFHPLQDDIAIAGIYFDSVSSSPKILTSH